MEEGVFRPNKVQEDSKTLKRKGRLVIRNGWEDMVK